MTGEMFLLLKFRQALISAFSQALMMSQVGSLNVLSLCEYFLFLEKNMKRVVSKPPHPDAYFSSLPAKGPFGHLVG